MKNLSLLLAIIFTANFACAQNNSAINNQIQSTILAEAPSEINYTVETVIPELAIPWGMAFLPDGSMLVTEKSGELIHFKDGKKTYIDGLPDIYVRGQGGLLDLELHPDYKNNGWIYFSFASAEGAGDGGNTAIMRAKLEGNKFVENQLLYKAGPNSRRGQHFGSRLEFDNEGYLYFSIGDRGNRDVNPQDITRDCGKIYRIHDDGRIPSDNPFVNSPNAKTAIYSYGHRNPQGMVKHPKTGKIWVHEHGPRGGDEINIIKKGKNFGWPTISYGINYNGTSFTENTALPKMEQPLFFWVPSIAPSGMAFVTSDIYPDWKGSLLAGSLKFEYLERVILKGDKVVKREKILDGLGRIRNVRQGPDGYIYAAVEGKGIIKIMPKK
ncbi:PQQ-dependent sugar dehydrogenase [Flavobacteriaceae bacterium AU392]|nr:PQQ-dependent sugar dehydrogenase [Flavobacteriaceae bacterium]RKM83651.1 PQQ-dependent sugar dehydrogenase [Flavobacteriaceae bacterium AU392]